MEEVYYKLSEDDIEARLLGKGIPENCESVISTIEKETEELLLLGKVIKKIAGKHPEVIDFKK